MAKNPYKGQGDFRDPSHGTPHELVTVSFPLQASHIFRDFFQMAVGLGNIIGKWSKLVGGGGPTHTKEAKEMVSL